MSQVFLENPLLMMTGKVNKKSSISYRRNGDKIFTYTLKHPRTETDFSEHEKAYRRHFGSISKEASRICHDEHYATKFNDFEQHGYLSRHKYVMHLLATDAFISTHISPIISPIYSPDISPPIT